MTDRPRRAEPSPEARELLARHDPLDLAEMLAAVHHLGEQQRAKVARVTGLYEQWVKAGPPPLGTLMARWWDTRLAELHTALNPTKEQ